MADSYPKLDPEFVARIIEEFRNWWSNQARIQAVRQSETLRFRRDGMLQELQEIRDERATDATFKSLKKKFKESAAFAQEAKDQFQQTYLKLESNIRQGDDNKILKQLDLIWHHTGFGKLPIRRSVLLIINQHASLTPEELRISAKNLCNEIETFNAEIDRLHKFVFAK